MNSIIKLFNRKNISRLGHFLISFYHRFGSEKIMKEASNLTFVTVLGFVPFLLFIVFLLPQIQSLHFQMIIQKYIVATFLPESADLIITQVNDLMKLTVQMNILNLIMLLITSYSLFASITGSFDKILKVEVKEDKSVITYLMKFFGTIIIGFIMMFFLFSMSSLPFISLLFEQPTIKLFITKLIPFFIWFLLIFFIYMFVPSKRFKPRNIAICAIYVAFVWFFLKNGFDWYINNMTKMKAFYGVVSSFPIFLFWIYANWIIVLSGTVLLSMLNKTEIKKKVTIKSIIQISIEDEKELNLVSDKLLNSKQKAELENWVKENLK